MKANYVHKDTLTATDYVELNKNNELLINYNQALLKENKELKEQQKEFISYLENEIKLYKNDIQNFSKKYNVYFSLINDFKVGKARTEEILQEYKSIIGYNEDE